jgi:thiol-disulfide isomerase/thioredoxin
MKHAVIFFTAAFGLFGFDTAFAQTTVKVNGVSEHNTLTITPPPKDLSEHNWDTRPFELSYADGRRLHSDTLKGKAVFIDAWATWCAPCMPSLPKFKELYEKSLTNPHVKVLSVHYGDRYGRFNSAAEFLQNKGLYYPVLQDTDGNLVKSLDTVQSGFSVPHYVLMDGSGEIVRRYGEINDMVILDVNNYFISHSKAVQSGKTKLAE